MESERRQSVDVGPTDAAPYSGALGRTRTEMAQTWMPDGTIQVLSVYTGVDAAADPTLARIACAGTLHQLGSGVELAIPFTYHDPLQRIFVVVVPESLRHRALDLRAEHMALIAADVEHAVPDYVRECEIVIGAAGLAARVDVDVAEPAGPDLNVLDSEAALSSLREREPTFEQRERLRIMHEQEAHARGKSLPAGAVLDSELQEVAENEPLEFGETVLAETLELNVREDAELLDRDEELEDVEDLHDAEEFDDGDEVKAIDR